MHDGPRGQLTARGYERYFAVMTKCPRRFCAPAGFVLLGADRRFFALADHQHPVGCDAEADEIVLDGVAAALAERQVVLVGAARVRVTLDRDPR